MCNIHSNVLPSKHVYDKYFMNDIYEELEIDFPHMVGISYSDFVHACKICNVDPEDVRIVDFNSIFKTEIKKEI